MSSNLDLDSQEAVASRGHPSGGIAEIVGLEFRDSCGKSTKICGVFYKQDPDICLCLYLQILILICGISIQYQPKLLIACLRLLDLNPLLKAL